MYLTVLDSKLWFPPATATTEDGLLAMGGDLSEERLLLAYRQGIFPWFEGDLPLWWCPDPRFVLFPDNLKISKSMQKILHNNSFQFKTNTAFEEVIRNCKTVKRDHAGTWITNAVEQAYINLHKKGYAHSAEAWQGNELAGGLYGIKMGKVFFGESMFSRISNASKFAFINYVKQLAREGIVLIDCQVYTKHLESLGAEMISRNEFLNLLQQIA
ncbi:leucyl/phenylalanyl-tRNA--protein transferase [Parafilimonas terrae]|uniref:Leucyl/phenylalanyl-tRNA--protein transferase n=1 Tax=Parafilimonas terrae TaxID=1465490 RepID=A0A1I5WA27_9BACT|nr:leucyl/phenylalanyl-tRNA--protein transferase [Parafilimonas terrae]SFQ16555.1 leucyl/phenylalanyl-tRNA--protein transferase [Parafilimonas terrae]